MPIYSSDIRYAEPVRIPEKIVQAYDLIYAIRHKLSGMLSLYTTGAVTTGQLFYLIYRNAVVVAFDGVLECGSGNCKFYRILGGFAAQQGINQAAAEGITAAYTVGNMQMIFFGEAIIFSVIQHGCPAVVIRGNRGTECRSRW